MATQAKFARLTETVGITLPEARITGQDPDTDSLANHGSKSGPIVHTRNGLTISLRRWAEVKTWRISFLGANESRISALRFMHTEQVFFLFPNGTDSLKYKVRWMGDFNPQYVGPDLYDLEFTIEQVV